MSDITPDGQENPILFSSQIMTSSGCNYLQIETKILSLVYGVKKFHRYLFRRQYTLLTDHKPLATFFGPKRGVPTLVAACLQRWALILSA